MQYWFLVIRDTLALRASSPTKCSVRCTSEGVYQKALATLGSVKFYISRVDLNPHLRFTVYLQELVMDSRNIASTLETDQTKGTTTNNSLSPFSTRIDQLTRD